MSLPRLLAGGLSAASGRLRSLSTTAASHHPPWAMVDRISAVNKSQPPTFHLAEPPRYSYLQMPADLINTSDEPGPDSDAEQLLGGFVLSSSSGANGLLLVMCLDGRVASPVLARQGGKQVRHWTGEPVHGHKPDFTYLICNPLSGQVSRVPNIRGTTKILRDLGLGLLAQVDRGYGLPDRFAIAMLMADNRMLRFSSETGDWDLATGREPPGPRERPFQRAIATNQEAVAFGGRLWWVDLSCRAVSVDPFSNWPESRFVDLPKGSVLPGPGPGTHGADAWLELRQYRRMGVSDGRLRYAEVSQREPFVLSYFALDEEGAGGDWTLEHRVALSRVWAADRGHHPWLPLQGDTATPEIAVLDPLNANVIHLIVGDHVVAVDMYAAKVIGSSPLRGHGDNHGFIPCVLGSGQIPSTGKDVSENQSFAHVRVHSNSHWKYEGY